MGPKKEAALAALEAKLAAIDGRLDDHEGRIDVLESNDPGFGDEGFTTVEDWQKLFPLALLPTESADQHHGETLGWIGVRYNSDDLMREILPYVGYKDGTKSGEPWSYGYRMEHRKAPPEGTVWLNDGNSTHYLIMEESRAKDPQFAYPATYDAGEVRGKTLPESPPGTFTWNIVTTLEFGNTFEMSGDPSTTTWPDLSDRVVGKANGTSIGWVQVRFYDGKNAIYTVKSFDGKAYLMILGNRPTLGGSFEIRDGGLWSGTNPYPYIQYVQQYGEGDFLG